MFWNILDISLRKLGIDKFCRRSVMASICAVISLTLIFITCLFQANPAQPGETIKRGAIIISGDSEPAFDNDVSSMVNAFTNPSGFYQIPSGNVYSGGNQTYEQFTVALNGMVNSGVSELEIYLTTHHHADGTIHFADGDYPDATFVQAILAVVQSGVEVNIVIDACYSGMLYDDLTIALASQCPTCTIISSTDEYHTSDYLEGAYSCFTSWFSGYLNSGSLTLKQAFEEVLQYGSKCAKAGLPKGFAIPTLSEWKQIFLT